MRGASLQAIDKYQYLSKLGPFWRGYAIAFAGVIAVFGLKLLFAPLLLDQSPFFLLLPAVLVASALGGGGAGLFATTFGLVLWVLWSADFQEFDKIGAVLFAGIGAGIAWWGGRLRAKRERAASN